MTDGDEGWWRRVVVAGSSECWGGGGGEEGAGARECYEQSREKELRKTLVEKNHRERYHNRVALKVITHWGIPAREPPAPPNPMPVPTLMKTSGAKPGRKKQ